MNNIYLKIILLFAISLSSTPYAVGIENGERALDENVVGLSYGRANLFCSGAVIEPRIIATAHHCLRWPSSSVSSASLLNIQVASPGRDTSNPQVEMANVIEIVSNDYPWRLGDCEKGFCDDLDDLAFLIVDRDLPVPANLKIASEVDIKRFQTNGVRVTTYGYGLIGYEKAALGMPHKMNGIFGEPNQGGYGKLAFNIIVSGIQNVCAGDSGGPTYVVEDGFLYYIGPTSGTRRPSCIQTPILDRGYYGGTPVASKEFLLTRAQKLALETKTKAEAKLKEEAELKAKHEVEAKAKAESEAKAALELNAKQEADAKSKAEAANKKTTIICVKGKLTKKISTVNPKCPKGYKKK